MTLPTGHPAPAPGTGRGWDDERLLAFAERQARPMRLGIDTDGDDRAPVPVRPPGGAVADVALPGGLHRDIGAAPYPRGRAPDGLPTHRRVFGVLAASGVQRFEVRSAVNPHRGYPAAHCFFAAQTFLLSGGAAWHFDTAGHRLRGVGDAAAGPARAPAPESIDAAGGAVLAVLCHPRSIPSRYRELRWALALCEAGHLAELLVQLARAYGLAVRVCRDFPDRAVLAAAGGGAEWMPACLVELGAARAADALPVAEADAEPGAGPAPEDPALAVDRRAWSGAPPSPADRTRPAPRPGAGTGRSWSRVVFERSSGHGNKGFTASPAPLAAAALDDAAAALADALGDQPGLGAGGIRTLLLAGRVAGRERGLYEIDRAGWTHALEAGSEPGLGAVQRAFSYPLTQMSLTSCAAALVFTMDQRAQLARGGPRRLRTAQLDLGAAAQAAGLALSAHGAFLRPARSFDPDLLAADLRLPDDQLPGYIALVGVSRFTDLLLDVRP
ncbi:nitroreductase family protein [Streptomonospora wellingtoniae]|uniref:Nitroreductase domain-containing protein n=1 Tax=Streptomonospora wellingtoniae TaxID=3075544 RepID=A0ABU2KRL8_9ACTN|nr:hypothetical protein [Streptomonospora sp. DSM 45055]MDT0301905.1 hypothetical protein [Streptomonospora sp. DSM 45055]